MLSGQSCNQETKHSLVSCSFLLHAVRIMFIMKLYRAGPIVCVLYMISSHII